MVSKIDERAMGAAVKKLRKLRLETVYGRKEHPAETVASMFDRGYRGAGSAEGVDYIMRHFLKYYLEEAHQSQPVPVALVRPTSNPDTGPKP